jgi:hypothetical protein
MTAASAVRSRRCCGREARRAAADDMARSSVALPRRRVDLDVREDLRAGAAVRQDRGRRRPTPDSVLVLRAPFEPCTLPGLARRGFALRRVSRPRTGVWFYREGARQAAAASFRGRRARSGPPRRRPIPAGRRGLEPLPWCVSAVGLAPGQRLEVLHHRRPVFLYPQLEERGCRHETDEPEPGLVRIALWRGGSAA